MAVVLKVIFYVLLIVLIFFFAAAVLLPFPPVFYDRFIAANYIIYGALALLAACFRPMEDFWVFSRSIVLVSIYQIAIAFALMRHILLHADGGAITFSLGNFIVGGNFVVGSVIFALIYICFSWLIFKFCNITYRNAEEINDREMKLAAKSIQRTFTFSIVLTAILFMAGLFIVTYIFDMPVQDGLLIYTLLAVGFSLAFQLPSVVLASTTAFLAAPASQKRWKTTLALLLILLSAFSLLFTGIVLFLMPCCPIGIQLIPFLICMSAVYWLISKDPRGRAAVR